MSTLATTEILETLIRGVGGVQQVADLLGVTPQAVGVWRRQGALSAANEKRLRRLALAHRTRFEFVYGWLRQLTTPLKAAAYELVVETTANDSHDMRGRTFIATDKRQRLETAMKLVTDYLDWEMLVDGDVLVFYRPDESGRDLTTFIYVNTDNVTAWFTRREWEPFWALVPFIDDRRKR